ncbi:hypothetical protein BROUX41_002314 [Berkeleyomyces rouxiae]|uniref:uncharacterized protein n=1 Tax=Berkeleyomyces rouxiae TaxID=2035830 RepID=UPI003B79B561
MANIQWPAPFALPNAVVGIEVTRLPNFGMLAKDGGQMMFMEIENDEPSLCHGGSKMLTKDGFRVPHAASSKPTLLEASSAACEQASQTPHPLQTPASLLLQRPSLSLQTRFLTPEPPEETSNTPGGLSPMPHSLRFNPDALALAQAAQRSLFSRRPSRARAGLRSHHPRTASKDSPISPSMYWRRRRSRSRSTDSSLGAPRHSRSRTPSRLFMLSSDNDGAAAAAAAAVALVTPISESSVCGEAGSGPASALTRSRRQSVSDRFHHLDAAKSPSSFGAQVALDLPNFFEKLDVSKLCDLENFLEKNLAIVRMAIECKEAQGRPGEQQPPLEHNADTGKAD